MSIDVTVIIPAFNHASYIRESVESVINQSAQCATEIIVIDDGSTDDTAKMLQPFVNNGQIKYQRQNNEGQSSARNAGLAQAKGEFIAFLDDDDAWVAGHLSRLIAFLRSNSKCVAVGGGVVPVDESGTILDNWGKPTQCFDFLQIFGECPFLSPGQVLIRHQAIAYVGGMNAEFWGTDDWDLWFKLAHLGAIVRIEHDSLKYRIHQGNASRNSARMGANALKVINRHLPSLPARERPQARKRAMKWTYEQFVRRAFRIGMSNMRFGQFGAIVDLIRLLPYVAFRMSEIIGKE